MADDKRQEPGSITKTADAQNERISGISNVSRTVTQMQKTAQRKIEETQDSIDYEGGSSGTSVKEMNRVLSSFGKTINAFTAGIQNVSMSTAKATKDAIGQYGKAVGQDINYNKQNMVAMALSRTTPLFGYFAAKFMETDVFQKAKERMKESIASTFKGIGSSIANIFKGGKNAKEKKPPKMQSGGYIEKGGMVEVHPAEVVMPIEKILSRIDDSISVSREIATISEKNQLRSLAKMATFVGGEKGKEPVGLVKGFLRAMREVQTQYEEPANMRMLRAVLSIQDTLGSTIGTWEQVWTKMLIEHPTFRQLAFAAKISAQVFGSPFKFVWKFFKSRGGYKSHLSTSDNPFQALNENIGLVYTGTMWRLDNIAKFTKFSAQASVDLASMVTGKKYPKVEGIKTGVWSLFGLARKGVGLLAKPLHKLALKSAEPMVRLFAYELEKPFVNVFDKVFKHQAAMKQLYGGEELVTNPVQVFEELIKDQRSNKIPPLLTMNVDTDSQEEIGQWLKNISKNTGSTADELDKHNDRERRKGVMGWLKGLGSSVWGMLMMGGNFIKDLLGFGPGGWMTNAVKGLATTFGASLASAGIMGTIVAGLVAALGGYAIGTWVNKNIIEPYIMKPYYDKQQKLQQQGNKENAAMSKKLMDEARGKTATGKQSYQAKIVSSARTGLKTQEGLLGADLAASKVMSAQSKFIDKNRAKYAQYDEEEIAKARERWRHSLGYNVWYRWKSTGANPEEFGTKKEAAFLEYLQKVGTKNKDLAGSIKKHQEASWKSKSTIGKAGYATRSLMHKEGREFLIDKGKYAFTQAGQWVEKATGRILDAKEIAKIEAAEILATSKLVTQELKRTGLKQMEGLDDLGNKIESNMSTVTNVINQSASQVTRVFNSGKQALGLMDEMNQRIITGNFH